MRGSGFRSADGIWHAGSKCGRLPGLGPGPEMFNRQTSSEPVVLVHLDNSEIITSTEWIKQHVQRISNLEAVLLTFVSMQNIELRNGKPVVKIRTSSDSLPVFLDGEGLAELVRSAKDLIDTEWQTR